MSKKEFSAETLKTFMSTHNLSAEDIAQMMGKFSDNRPKTRQVYRWLQGTKPGKSSRDLLCKIIKNFRPEMLKLKTAVDPRARLDDGAPSLLRQCMGANKMNSTALSSALEERGATAVDKSKVMRWRSGRSKPGDEHRKALEAIFSIPYDLWAA